MPPVGVRTRTQIERDIEHRSRNALDQLGLGMRRGLQVKPAHGSPVRVARQAALRKLYRKPVLSEFLPAKDPAEAAAVIAGKLDRQLNYTCDVRRSEPHAQPKGVPAAGSARRSAR